MRTFLQQDEIRSELSSLQTAMDTVIAKIAIRNQIIHLSRYAHSVNLPNYPVPGRSSILYEPHESRRRKGTTRASLTALENAFILNPKPSAVLRKQVCEIVHFLEKHEH